MPRRGRGRPSSLNRAKVIQSALKLIEKNPHCDITMTAVAEQLGIVTMGLYKHVKNKDDLLAGMAEAMFADMDLSIDGSQNLDRRFYQWTAKYREFFVQRPYASRLIAWHNHIAIDFMNWSADLVGFLQEYGVPKKDLSKILAWLSRQLNAYIMLEQSARTDQKQLIDAFDVTRLPAAKQQLLKPLLPQLANFSNDDFYQFHIEATLSTLKQMASK